MDCNQMLNNLIQDYRIDRHIPMYGMSQKAIAIAKRFYGEKESEKIILAGTTSTDLAWYNTVICQNAVTTFLVDDIDDMKMPEKYEYDDLFLVVSYENRHELVGSLQERGVKAVSIYDVFEQEGFYFYGNFYDVYQNSYRKYMTGMSTRDMEDFDLNRIFFIHRKRFEQEPDLKLKRKYLEILIFDCVYAKDFLTLKKYVDIYVEEFGEAEAGEYVHFYNDVMALLQQIKDMLKVRKRKDCIMHWIDALEYGEDSDMPFLKGLNGKALWFDNIYTVTPFTYPTFVTLFAQKRFVEDEGYKIKKVGEGNSPLIVSLRKRGYKFKYYGSLSQERVETSILPNYFFTSYTPMTQIYWDMLSDVLMSEESLFCVLHEDFHTHFPFVSMGLTGQTYHFYARGGDASSVERQHRESKEYVDRQLEFWARLLPEHMYKIYMSDHGHTTLGRFHSIMKIQQKDIKPCVVKGLISYYRFDKIVLQILDSAGIDEKSVAEDYILVQDMDWCSGEDILYKIRSGRFTEVGLMGFQGVITKDGLYIRYKDGTELYQKAMNDERMVTDAEIDNLRKLVSTKEVNIYQEDLCKYSRLVYSAYYKCKARTAAVEAKKKKAIKDLFADVSSHEILAIRGGGMCTVRLLMMLPEELRGKVDYVIDRNRECIAGKLGIKVLVPEEYSQCKIDCIVIATYDYRESWKAECINKTKARVVDLYELLEEHGIHCTREFYMMDYASEDFEEGLLQLGEV